MTDRLWNRRTAMTAVLVALTCLLACEAGPPNQLTEAEISAVAVPRLATPPTLDGIIDPAEWRDAAAISGGVSWADNALLPRPTTFFVAWDPKHLTERLSPVPGLAQGGLICRMDIGSQILGYAANPQTKKSVLYVYDLAEKKVLRRVDVEAPADRLFRRPVDGTFWAATPNALYRIDPDAPAMRTIGVTDRDMSCFTWAGMDLYAAHGGELVRITAPAE